MFEILYKYIFRIFIFNIHTEIYEYIKIMNIWIYWHAYKIYKIDINIDNIINIKAINSVYKCLKLYI